MSHAGRDKSVCSRELHVCVRMRRSRAICPFSFFSDAPPAALHRVWPGVPATISKRSFSCNQGKFQKPHSFGFQPTINEHISQRENPAPVPAPSALCLWSLPRGSLLSTPATHAPRRARRPKLALDMSDMQMHSHEQIPTFQCFGRLCLRAGDEPSFIDRSRHCFCCGLERAKLRLQVFTRFGVGGKPAGAYVRVF